MAAPKGDDTFKNIAKKQLAVLRAAGDIAPREDRLARGDRLTLRHGQSHGDAMREIKADHEDLMQEGTWTRRFNYRPADGQHALMSALRGLFGSVVTPGQMHSFFGMTWVDPPVFVDIEVGVGEYTQVVADALAIPALEGVVFYLGAGKDPDRGLLFEITATGKKIWADEIQVIFNLVEDELQRNSIYRGKAIDDGYHFLDLTGIDPDKVVYAEAVQDELESEVFARLRYPDLLEDHGVEVRGAILLAGTFGTGKTLAAYLAAIEAEKNGWGFILVRPEALAGDGGVEAFRQAMQTAQLMGRTVIFVEDVDTLTGHEQEADRISIMLDLFDGARAKGHDVIVILTTNYVEAITPGMLRNGRISKVIEIGPPDDEGVVKLCKVLVDERLLDPTIPDEGTMLGEERVFGWNDVAEAMRGFIPAAIKAACDGAFRWTIVRLGGEVNGHKINAEDLVRSARSLHRQQELLQKAIAGEPEVDSLGVKLRYEMDSAARTAVAEIIPEVLEGMVEEFGFKRVK